MKGCLTKERLLYLSFKALFNKEYFYKAISIAIKIGQ
jgi:hypothetical protein